MTYALLSPDDGLPRFPWLAAIPYYDKWIHFGLFAILIVLLLAGMRAQSFRQGFRPNYLWLSAILCIVYGAFTEVLQEMAAAGRTADIFDFMADTVGIFSGIGVFLLLSRRHRKEKSRS